MDIAPIPVVGCMGSFEVFELLETKLKKIRLVSLVAGSLFPPKKAKKRGVSGGGGVLKANWLEKHVRSSLTVLVVMVPFRAVSSEVQVGLPSS